MGCCCGLQKDSPCDLEYQGQSLRLWEEGEGETVMLSVKGLPTTRHAIYINGCHQVCIYMFPDSGVPSVNIRKDVITQWLMPLASEESDIHTYISSSWLQTALLIPFFLPSIPYQLDLGTYF